MIERVITAQILFAWVTGDEAYGDNGPLRAWLEDQHLAYVLAVSCDHRVPAGAGRVIRADQLAARLPQRAWQRLSAGQGAKGHRYYDWAWAVISDNSPGYRCLLIRRNHRTGELAFYRCYSQHCVTLAALVKAAGRRWTIEENFQAGKGLTGLDEHQTRYRRDVPDAEVHILDAGHFALDEQPDVIADLTRRFLQPGRHTDD
jgi:SRSO17 transposase